MLGKIRETKHIDQSASAKTTTPTTKQKKKIENILCMHCVNGKGIGNDISSVERESKRVTEENPEYWNGKVPNGEWAEEKEKKTDSMGGWVCERIDAKRFSTGFYSIWRAVAARLAKATMVLGWIKNLTILWQRQRAFCIVFGCQSLCSIRRFLIERKHTVFVCGRISTHIFTNQNEQR